MLVADPSAPLSEEMEKLIEEALSKFYDRAVAMHESIAAGHGAIAWDDQLGHIILTNLVRKALGTVADDLLMDRIDVLDTQLAASREQARALAEGLRHVKHRTHPPSLGCDGCINAERALAAFDGDEKEPKC